MDQFVILSSYWSIAPFAAQVPVTAVLSYFTLGEQLTHLDIVGGALIIIGLLLVVYSNWYSEKVQKESKESLVFGRTEEERRALLSSQSQRSVTVDDDVFDSPHKAKSFTAGHIQQH